MVTFLFSTLPFVGSHKGMVSCKLSFWHSLGVGKRPRISSLEWKIYQLLVVQTDLGCKLTVRNHNPCSLSETEPLTMQFLQDNCEIQVPRFHQDHQSRSGGRVNGLKMISLKFLPTERFPQLSKWWRSALVLDEQERPFCPHRHHQIPIL